MRGTFRATTRHKPSNECKEIKMIGMIAYRLLIDNKLIIFNTWSNHARRTIDDFFLTFGDHGDTTNNHFSVTKPTWTTLSQTPKTCHIATWLNCHCSSLSIFTLYEMKDEKACLCIMWNTVLSEDYLQLSPYKASTTGIRWRDRTCTVSKSKCSQRWAASKS